MGGRDREAERRFVFDFRWVVAGGGGKFLLLLIVCQKCSVPEARSHVRTVDYPPVGAVFVHEYYCRLDVTVVVQTG
jgi:hypothetical protein